MNIIPSRNMFLDDRRVEKGRVETVSKSAGELALRHRWAVLAEGAPAGKNKKAEGGEGGAE